jgi:hypothetical protein
MDGISRWGTTYAHFQFLNKCWNSSKICFHFHQSIQKILAMFEAEWLVLFPLCTEKVNLLGSSAVSHHSNFSCYIETNLWWRVILSLESRGMSNEAIMSYFRIFCICMVDPRKSQKDTRYIWPWTVYLWNVKKVLYSVVCKWFTGVWLTIFFTQTRE